MISPIFAESNEKELFDLLRKFLKDQDDPISKEKYLMIQKELGLEPDPKVTPLSFEDIPEDCQLAITIHSKLGNRVYGDVGYTGKDYTNLPILINIFSISNKILLLDLLNTIDTFFIEKSQKQIKKMYDDVKKKK